MIVAYAQAANRQGLEAAINGQLVAPEEGSFAALRATSVSLNLSSKPRTVGGVEVRYGRGILRLELLGLEAGAADLSPIVVVAKVAELQQGRVAAVRLAIETVAALGRECDASAIEAGFALGESLHQSSRITRRVATVAAVALLAVAVVWISRGCAAPGGIVGSADSWSH